MKIDVSCDNISDKDFIFQNEKIQDIASCILSYLIDNNLAKDFSENNDYEFDVVLTNNAIIHETNKKYRNKDCPTDVITFALYADSLDKIIIDNTIALGQIMLSVDKVTSQANENNVSETYEFLNLLSHGILHLLGYIHETENELETMLELQKQIIGNIKDVKI